MARCQSYRRWSLLILGVTLIAVRARSDMALIVLGGPNHGAGSLPSEWQVKEHSGQAHITGCSGNDGFCVHFTSRDSSFSLERSVEVNPADLPYLSWRWKVTRLPQAGDFRRASRDDQAAQLLVAL